MSKILNASGIPVQAEPSLETKGTAIELATNFDLMTGLGTVKLRIPGTDKAYIMLPAEARIFGMRLICEAERAVGDAIFMRVAIEMMGASPQEAAELVRTVGAGTRAEHAAVYERMMNEAQREKAMAQKVPGETGGTPQG